MIRIDFSNLMQEAIGKSGLMVEDFDAVNIQAVTEMMRIRKYHELEFLDLPCADTSEIKKIGRYVRNFENFIILGIGGSALGPRSILEAMSPFHNLKNTPRVFIYDNVDPLTLSSILELISPSTVVNVITKSGSTAETVASFMVLWDKLIEKTLRPEDHIIVTTDPNKGNMRRIVKDYGLMSLPIPDGVVGRYSVLSPVGLLLAEAIGVNSDDLLKGASDIYTRCAVPDIWQNPAYLFAAGLFLMEQKKGRNITVMMPYADGLKPFSEWFCQLWAESLGKEGKGLTPYPSLGATDQHSQLQLWMEGPEDKVVVFISIEDHRCDIQIPTLFSDIEGINYLSGHTLGELIKIEQEASEIALSKNGKPSITIRLPKLDAYHLGQLFQFFEITTAVTGFLYNINPFNQPGVEEGKNLTYGMMGKKGYEEKRKDFELYRRKTKLEL